MTFRATAPGAGQAFDKIRLSASQLKSYLMTQRALMIQAPVSANIVINTIQILARHIGFTVSLISTPGLVQYAKDQINDPSYDVVVEFNAMLNAAIAARDGLLAVCPRDGNGFLLYQSFNADGTIAIRTFTPAQLASVVSLINAVVDAID